VQKPGPQLSEPKLDDPKQMLPFHEIEDLKLQASLSEVGRPHVGQREPESTHHILKCKKPKLALGTLVAVLTLDWLFTAIQHLSYVPYKHHLFLCRLLFELGLNM
jgi:hypothetical protein